MIDFEFLGHSDPSALPAMTWRAMPNELSDIITVRTDEGGRLRYLRYKWAGWLASNPSVPLYTFLDCLDDPGKHSNVKIILG